MTITTEDRLKAILQCIRLIPSAEQLEGNTTRRALWHAHRITIAATNDLDAPKDYLTADRALALLGVLVSLSSGLEEMEGEDMANRAKHQAEQIVILAMREHSW